MTLDEYCRGQGVSDAAFAKLVKKNKSTVFRWRTGRVKPTWEALQAIMKATDGAVTPTDFIDIDAQSKGIGSRKLEDSWTT